MNLDQLQKKLVAAAKHNSPSDRVPYAFERRIMAGINSLQPVNVWSLWGQPLWRAAIGCMAVTVLIGALSVDFGSANDQDNFSQDFESAVFAGMNQHVEDAAQ